MSPNEIVKQTFGWYPVSDHSETVRFGEVVDVKHYFNYSVWEIKFEDNSRAFLSNKKYPNN